MATRQEVLKKYNNKPERKARMKQYAIENRDKILEYKTKYNHSSNRVTRDKLYYEANKEKFMANLYKRKQKYESQLGYLPKGSYDLVLEFYGRKCLIPHCDVSGKISMDHVIPLSKGGKHDIFNLQPLCLSHNCQKQDRHIDYRPLKMKIKFIEYVISNRWLGFRYEKIGT